MIRKALISLLMITLPLVSFTGCEKQTEPTETGYYQYLGNIDYTSSVSAYVWEQVDGEDEGVFGIQYRAVEDFNGLTSQSDIPVCLYFYSSSAQGSQSLTAGVEDLAQTLAERVLFIGVDGVYADDISTAYHVGGYPEFVLIVNDVRVSTFSGYDYDYWSIEDVSAWMSDNGYEPDLSMLER